MNYEILKGIHTLAAYAWLGSLFGTLIFTTLASRQGAGGAVKGAIAIMRFSTRIGLPSAILLLISGIWMVAGYGVANGLWITLGFLGWLVAAVVGSALMHPIARKMRNTQASDDEMLRYARTIVLIAAAEIIVIVLSIWVMGAKPGS